MCARPSRSGPEHQTGLAPDAIPSCVREPTCVLPPPSCASRRCAGGERCSSVRRLHWRAHRAGHASRVEAGTSALAATALPTMAPRGRRASGDARCGPYARYGAPRAHAPRAFKKARAAALVPDGRGQSHREAGSACVLGLSCQLGVRLYLPNRYYRLPLSSPRCAPRLFGSGASVGSAGPATGPRPISSSNAASGSLEPPLLQAAAVQSASPSPPAPASSPSSGIGHAAAIAVAAAGAPTGADGPPVVRLAVAAAVPPTVEMPTRRRGCGIAVVHVGASTLGRGRPPARARSRQGGESEPQRRVRMELLARERRALTS